MTTLPSPDVLNVDDLRVYAQCSLAWFWRSVLVEPGAMRCADLFEDQLREGLRLYLTGVVGRLTDGVAAAWRAWCAPEGDAALLQDLLRYAAIRARILETLSPGRTRASADGPAGASRQPAKYRQLMRESGLVLLARRLDDAARRRGYHGDVPGAGSRLGDAFADSLAAVERMGRTEPALPERGLVRGVDIPFRVTLTPIVQLEGQADLVAATVDDPDQVHLELHDFSTEPGPRPGVAARDPRVIAALLARPLADVEALRWTSVSAVTVRHWRSGTAVTVREGNPGYLLNLVSGIARGIRERVVVPRALCGRAACVACAYEESCWSPEGWRALPLLVPHLVEAERSRLDWADAPRA